MQKIFTKVLTIIISIIFIVSSNIYIIHADDNSAFYNTIGLTNEEIAILKEAQKQVINVASYNIAASGSDKKNLFILNEISKGLNLKFNFINYKNSESALKGVESGEVSFVANVWQNPRRAKLYAFSGIVDEDTMWMYAKKSDILNNMASAKIGVQADSLWEMLAHKFYPESTIVSVKDVNDINKKFDNNEINVLIGNNDFYKQLIFEDKYPLKINKDYRAVGVYIAGTKDKTKRLLEIFTKFISSKQEQAKISEFNKQFYNDINISFLKVQLNKLKIDKQKIYKVAMVESSPYTTYHNGKWTGIFPEMLDYTMNEIGLKYQIVTSGKDTWNDIYKNFLSGQYDIILPISETSDNKKNVNYSESIEMSQCLLIKNSSNKKNLNNGFFSLVFEKIGVVDNTFFSTYFTNYFPNKKLEYFETYDDCIKALKNGTISYMPMSKVQFYKYVNANKDFSIVEDDNIGSFTDMNIRYGFRKTQEGQVLSKLFSYANRTIDTTSINTKYIQKLDLESYYKTREWIYFLTISLFILSSFGLVFFTLYFRKMSRYDALSGLLNRNALLKDYKNGITKTESLIILDINNFKEINDVYGHNIGDEVIINFAKQRFKDDKLKVYRIGGDEFVIIYDTNKSKFTIDEVIDAISSFDIVASDGIMHKITSAVGVLPGTLAKNRLNECLVIVDMAMYESKKQSIPNVFITEEKLKTYKERIIFKKTLEIALENNEFYAHFQPIVNIKTHKVVAVETLSRWSHNGVQIPIGKYLSEAKLLNIENKIDLESYKYAGIAYKKLKKLGYNIRFSVNMCEKSIINISNGTANIQKFGIPTNMLSLEILEDVILDDRCIEYTNIISKLGYNLSIDDFGAGNTSLQYLKNINYGTIKIDRSLVPVEFDKAHSNMTIIESQINMLNKLGKKIIVEGVETKEQLDYLESIGAVLIQGYYFAKPMSIDDLAKFIVKFNGEVK